ncbi:MAG: DUF1553 domain-containing protein [Planctomycetes bacterium]|nr:DUF1553 domain-containing protein [Planctomycetota bacterium]
MSESLNAADLLVPPAGRGRGLAVSIATVIVLSGAAPGIARAQDDASVGAAVSAFEEQVAPTLAQECVRCHGPAKQRSKLRVDTRAALLVGGKRGAALVAGDPEASVLIHALRRTDAELEMPPSHALADDVTAAFERWIRGGAPWPDGRALPDAEVGGADAQRGGANGDAAELPETWAFEPPQPHATPPLPEAPAFAHFVRDPLDAFVAAQLLAAGLAPSPDADARTLIRRATLDVTGLPPTPEEVAAFVEESRGDDSAGERAYVRLIERLLASPHFGERSAADWLDLVRFAETNGFEMNQPRADAWPYRDWVIDAFNRDLPFADFVRAQLAGDQLGEDAATGFLVAGAWDEVKSPDPELTAVQRDDELHGIVATTSAALLGLTVGCAKCHDHKFDPLDQHDYYALRACFAGVQIASRPWRRALVQEALPGREPVEAARNLERFAPVVAQRVRFVVSATSDAEPCLDELEIFSSSAKAGATGAAPRNVALASEGAVARASSVYAGNPRHTLEHVNDGRYGNDWSWIPAERAGWVEIELSRPTAIDTVVWGRDRTGEFRDRVATGYRIEVLVDAGVWSIVASSGDRRPPPAPEPTLFAGRFDAAPPVTRRLERGNPLEPREEVAPGGVARLHVPFALGAANDEPARRRALAEWMVAPENTLWARVIVNRIWQQHFGRGLVGTPSDFGAMGMRPSHPELLDTLACDFVRAGGSMKALHRRLLLSATWRQSSRPRADALALDASNRLLWRFAPRRLPAEAIRDSMLAVAGVLDLTLGGPSVSPFAPNDNYVRVYEPKLAFGPADFRRSIYLLRVRMHPEPTFAAFDLPDGGQPCPRRGSAITPLQALALTHAPFVLEAARRFAERLASERPGDLEAQLRCAFELAFARAPDEAELGPARAVAREHGLAICCRALLDASEFLWLE